MHIKGLENPGYDARGLKTFALGLAVGTRGGCHNRTAAYDPDFRSMKHVAGLRRAQKNTQLYMTPCPYANLSAGALLEKLTGQVRGLQSLNSSTPQRDGSSIMMQLT